MAIDFKKIYDILNSFDDSGVIEDRFEYTQEDLASSNPDLNEAEVAILYCLLQDWREFGGIDFDNIDPKIMKEYLKETLHNSFDGWRDEAKITLMSMMFDLMRYNKKQAR